MCKLLSENEWKVVLWSLFVFFFVVPVSFNFLLPIETGLVVLGNQTDWLHFWASYLAAIGSFIMALVALWMNKRLHQQNEKSINYIRLDKMVNRYSKIERFIVEEEQMHSELALCNMLSFIEMNDLPTINRYLGLKAQALLSCSLKIARFSEQDMAWDYTTETGLRFNEYGSNVQKVNVIIYDAIVLGLKNSQNHKESRCAMAKEDWKEIISKIIDNNNLILNKLVKLRMNYLLAERNRILKFEKDNQLEVFL